jgi:hypothetical protein
VSCASATDKAPWLVDVAMHPLTGRKKTFGLVGRQREVRIGHRKFLRNSMPMF